MQINTKITGLTADSREVKAGYLFAALLGAKVDGRDYISKAIENGAQVIIAPTGTAKPEGDVEFITDDHPRRIYAMACADFYKNQPAKIVAVTGTNGKTSTVNFVQQLWQILGIKGASLGTLGVKTADDFIEGAMTTPDPRVMHQTLSDLVQKKITHVALEASSHGLDQNRLDGVNVHAAAFTNLTQDHLDYHGDMDAYFQAKAYLFSELLPSGGAAVLNSDMPYFEKIKGICDAKSLRVMGYGTKQGEYLSYKEPKATASGYDIELKIKGAKKEFHLPLVGRFQVDNALAAVLLVYGEGLHDLDTILRAAQLLKPVRGRLEMVSGHPKDAAIFVDYAHTPDALENALKSLRHHTKKRLICVFGCGGDRDKTKRPLMAAAAFKYSDVAILTDDNPRSEDPAAIRADALKGAPDALEIDDRREAIDCAVQIAEKGDVILVAGKGHEQGQEIMGVKHPFDDVSEVKKAIKGL